MVRGIRALPILVFALAVAQAVNDVISAQLGLSSSDSTASSLFLSIALSVAFVVFTAPVDIAFYRFFILAEVARGYHLDIGNRRYRHFCGWQGGISILFVVIDWAVGFLPSENFVKDLGMMLSLLASLACTAGTILIFPAIAVDAPETTLRNAFACVRGSFWRICWTLILVVIPILALIGMLWLVSAWLVGVDSVPDTLTGALLWWLASIIFNLVTFALAARLFILLWFPRSPAASQKSE